MLGLLQKKSQAEIFQVGCRSDPAISAEISQLWGFGKTWILKPNLGQCQLEVKIIFFFFPKKCPVINFVLSYLLAQRVFFFFLLNVVDT